ncbi:cell division protein ZapA [Virgibacillus xinjiangensis]|uniref:Cell division protein ZapA n=1 Tax=Virgibacillus xinjiangensis TaxID=393090 RepID=A0ABV7CUR0_9BACI
MARNEKERITVEIHNKKYTIVGEEPASHVRLVASLVDQKMGEIYQSNQHLDTTKLAVLTAVNTMNDYLKLKEDYAKLLGSMKDQGDHQRKRK